MIKIEFKEPTTEEWREWRRLCEIATRELCDAWACGRGVDVDERLYKKMRDVYLSPDGPFHGKCAYCESFIAADQPGDIDHFRPKAGVTDMKDEVITLSGQHSSLISHLSYLLLSAGDIKDPTGLIRKLSGTTPDPLSQHLWACIPLTDQTALQKTSLGKKQRKLILAAALNILLQGDLLYEPARFAGINLTPETQALLGKLVTGPSLVFLNRMLLAEAFPAEIRAVPHPGYFWLAYEWCNLLPTCEDCNRCSKRKTGGVLIGKGTRFPVSGQHATAPSEESHEKPLLINPASPDEYPSLHIEIDELGVVIPKSERGAACERIFGLNLREALVRKRKEAFEDGADSVLNLIFAWMIKDWEKRDRCLEKLEAYKAGRAPYSAAGRTGMSRKLGKEIPIHSALVDILEQLCA